jgi:hypothetical protein
VPHGEDARRVTADVVELDVGDALACVGDCGANGAETVAGKRHEHRLSRSEPLPNERYDSVQELRLIGVEERLVRERGAHRLPGSRKA